MRGTRNFAVENLDSRMRQGLIGHWMSGTGAGATWLDRSGYQNHGVFTGSPKWSLGGPQLNRPCVYFGQTSSDLVDCGVAPIATNLTAGCYAAWVYITSVPGEMELMAKIDGVGGWVWSIFGAGQLGFFHSTDGSSQGFNSTQLIPLNTPVHVAVNQPAIQVGNITNSQFFINGVACTFDGTENPGTDNYQTDAAAHLQIGGFTLVSGSEILGWMDDVRIYNRGLGANEIALLANPNFSPVMQSARRASKAPAGVAGFPMTYYAQQRAIA